MNIAGGHSLLYTGQDMRGLLACVMLGAALAWPTPDTVGSVVANAQALGRAGRWSEAERTLKIALERGEDAAQIHGELGLILYRQGRFRDAVPELGRAAQLDPESAEYSLKLAASILGDHRYSVAVELLQALAQRFANLAEYQYDLGVAYYGTREFKHAIGALEQAIQIDPKMDLAYFFLGNTWARAGDLDKAVSNYRKALVLNPTNAGYCLALGKVLGQSRPDNDAEAVQWLRTALKLKPGDAASEFALALACERVNDLRCARRLAEDVAKRYPDELSPAVVLARIYGRMNEPEKANAARATVRRLQRAPQRTPDTDRFPDADPRPSADPR